MIGAYKPLRSQTLHIPETGATGHLFVVLTDTCEEGHNLLVPICTARKVYDKTCILGAGDHEFIKHLSYVMYARLEKYEAADLIKQVNAGVISYRGLLDEKLFALVSAGVEQSDLAPPNMQAYFRAQMKQGS